MNNHENFELLLSQSMDGEISADQFALLRRHRQVCPDCRAQEALWIHARQGASQVFHAQRSAEFAQAVMARLGHSSRETVSAPKLFSLANLWSWKTAAILAAGIVIYFAPGYFERTSSVDLIAGFAAQDNNWMQESAPDRGEIFQLALGSDTYGEE